MLLTSLHTKAELPIGRVKIGSRLGRLTAHASLEHHDTHEGQQTVDHEPVTAPVARFSMSWSANVGGQLELGGQLEPGDRELITWDLDPAGIAAYRKLEQWWREYHLNDMHAGCSHMTDPADLVIPEDFPASRYGEADRRQDYALRHLVCPVTGYRYGRQWLVKPIPAHVQIEMVDALRILGAV